MYYYLFIFVLPMQLCTAKYFVVNKSNIFQSKENDKSLFGYSLQLQKIDFVEFGRIIVGAPKANSTKNKKYDENGAVFSCSISSRYCEEIPLKLDELKVNNIGLGSTIDADEYENGYIATCAPRWSDVGNSAKGICFSIKNDILKNKLYPLQNKPLSDNGFYYSQFGQTGFSAHLVKNQEHSLILGLPGIYTWAGTLAQYSDLDKNEKSNVASPYRKDNLIGISSYFGYSISAGRFNVSNPEQIFYVSGAPRNNDLYGSVNIFDPFENEPFKNRFMFRGTQFGEYFGASIAVGDLNADNLDDIVVGAPTHSTDRADDIGCIYEFHAVSIHDKVKFTKQTHIVGESKGSKFGFALSYLGDINSDGYGDIAVGAPYFDTHGAVYIYFGSKYGLQTDSKQKILASVIDSSLFGFGFSLSRGLDVDNNTNNDLAVGAYISGQVVLLTSRPIIKIQSTLNQISQLNINTQNLEIKYCMNYTSDERLPSNEINLLFSILYTYNATFENMKNFWTRKINMQGHKNLCETFKILVNGPIITGFTVNMNYEIVNTSLEDKFIPLEEHYSPSHLQIPFNKGCLSDICKPNLKLTTFLTNKEDNWIIGSSKNIQFDILLENTEEPSYTNKLIIHITPEYLKFASFPNYCDQSSNIVNCNFKYPILNNEKKNITFELDAKKLKIDDSKVILNATIISDKDTDTTDNTHITEIRLKSDVDFKILLKSQPNEINNLTGKQILNHQYNIENVGDTPVENLKISFFIPYKVKQTEFTKMTVSGCSQFTINENLISKNNENNNLILDFITDNALFINCTTLSADHVQCKQVECEVFNSLSSFSINVTMEIDTNLITEVHNEGPIILSTTLEPDSKFILTSSHIWTKLMIKQQTASITMYLIIGILLSLLLVSILVFILYKCGFFTKRKLPDKSEHEHLMDKEGHTSEPQF